MASEKKRKSIVVLMTPTVEVISEYTELTFKFKGEKYLKFIEKYHKLYGSDARLKHFVSIDAITDIEHNNRHIYLYRSGSNTYVDLDFSLVPKKLEQLKQFFDEMRKDVILCRDIVDIEYQYYYLDKNWIDFIEDLGIITNGVKDL